VLALSKCFNDEGEGEEAKEDGIQFFEAGEDAAIAFEPPPQLPVSDVMNIRSESAIHPED
jgi:hypothetical protein